MRLSASFIQSPALGLFSVEADGDSSLSMRIEAMDTLGIAFGDRFRYSTYQDDLREFGFQLIHVDSGFNRKSPPGLVKLQRLGGGQSGRIQFQRNGFKAGAREQSPVKLYANVTDPKLIRVPFPAHFRDRVGRLVGSIRHARGVAADADAAVHAAPPPSSSHRDLRILAFYELFIGAGHTPEEARKFALAAVEVS